jgi:hypothetical protein
MVKSVMAVMAPEKVEPFHYLFECDIVSIYNIIIRFLKQYTKVD